MTATASRPTGQAQRAGRGGRGGRAFWLRHLSRWHWISSAVSLAGLLLFAVTGITLNHAGDIEATPSVSTREAVMPPDLLETLKARAPGTGSSAHALPQAVAGWAADAVGIRTGDSAAEWSPNEVYVPLPRPGGDGWLSINLATGATLAEITDRGWVAYLNDLHKGRNTGMAWFWFIDVFAGAGAFFATTGLLLLVLHSGYRPGTWPVVGLGFAVPVLLIVLFIH